MTNLDGIKEINKLIELNPGVDVMFLTASEVVAENNYKYWKCCIGSVEMREVWYNENMDRYEFGKDDILEEILSRVEYEDDFCDLHEYEQEAEADKRYDEYKNNGEIKTYILVKMEV